MRPLKIDNSVYPRIENVQLISPEDPFYKLYCTKFKTVKTPQAVQTAIYTNQTAQLSSRALEDTVLEWIKKSGVSLSTRIISYDKYYRKNKFVRLFKELDYVLKKGDKLTIGELKVSNQNPISKALKQTYESRELLKITYPFIEVEIIWIDLNSEYSKEPINEFNINFLKSQYTDLEDTDDKYKFKRKIKFLHLDVQDIFNWGVENKIIRTPELILAALEEAVYIGKIKTLKDEIRCLKINTTDEIDEKTSIQISEYEKDIRANKARLELYQKGWSVIDQSIKSIVFKLIENETVLVLETNQSGELKTENQRVKFLVFQYPFQPEIQIIHAGIIYYCYRKVSQKEITDIENVFVHFETDKYPVLNNQGRRKFCYDINRMDISEKSNIGLQEFKRIVDNAEPLKILLNENEILILDNHVMLHKIST